jgi:hypothetical protein
MNNKFDRLSFLAYINNPMSKESIAVLYASNNVKYERCVLYGDFIISLMKIVFSTYMGDEITNNEEQLSHFNWCWEKNVNNFLDYEGIKIDSKYLYDYFLQFMIETFYSLTEKSEKTNEDLIILWSDIFNYTKPKTNSDIDMMLELYKIFEKSLNV